jgi:hypothetical protein
MKKILILLFLENPKWEEQNWKENGQLFIFKSTMMLVVVPFFLPSVIFFLLFSTWSFNVVFIGIWSWWFVLIYSLYIYLNLKKASSLCWCSISQKRIQSYCLRKIENERIKIDMEKEWEAFKKSKKISVPLCL